MVARLGGRLEGGNRATAKGVSILDSEALLKRMALTAKIQRLKTKARPPAALPAVSPATIDPLREIRALKRLVRVGVYAAILGTEPFYLFVLHYSWPQLLSGLIVGLIIATIAIEGAFGQMFKLRKRSAYPGLLLQALSSSPGVEAAAEQALPPINRLLRIRGSAVALGDESGAQRVLFVSAMSGEDARRLLELGQIETARLLAGMSRAPGCLRTPRHASAL
jgi:hypothetical protein